MITQIPVGSWSWGHDHTEPDWIELCMRNMIAGFRIMRNHDLAINTPKIAVRVLELDNPTHLLFDGDIVFDDNLPMRIASGLGANRVRSDSVLGTAGAVIAEMCFAGKIACGGEDIAQTRLFTLSANAIDIYASVSLFTFSDAWMRYDLRGNPQSEVYESNAGRLTAALNELADYYGDETDPGDPTYFGTPTPTGIDNHFEPDGSPSNVWHRFME